MGKHWHNLRTGWAGLALGLAGVFSLLTAPSPARAEETPYTVLTPEQEPRTSPEKNQHSAQEGSRATREGKETVPSPASPLPVAPPAVVRASGAAPEPAPMPRRSAPDSAKPAPPACPPPGCDGAVVGINLPAALELVNAANPTIALARERVREAYARWQLARTLWLPTLETGPTYNRHDGRIQNSHGDVFSTSKWNFFEGGGFALTVATADALFGPRIARELVSAQAAASRAVTNRVQLDTALAYLDLLRVYGALAVNGETLNRVRTMTRAAESALNRGTSKTGADLNRALTELNLREEERIDLQGQAAEASARLAQLLLLDPGVDLRPLDVAVLPITLVPETGVSFDQLVAVAWMNRPELAESRALVAAALARWRQSQYGPLLPRVDVTYLAGTFGGGINDETISWGSRGDGTAQVVWQLPGLGLAYLAETRVTRSQYNQAGIHVTEVQAQVAAEVVAAAKVSLSRRRALANAQEAVRQAEEMWRKLRLASFGIVRGGFDPLEPLLAEQQLNQARVQYLTQVIEYDRAQFRLYWALGSPPLTALPKAAAVPVGVEVAPRGLPPGPCAPPPPSREDLRISGRREAAPAPRQGAPGERLPEPAVPRVPEKPPGPDKSTPKLPSL